ncbi:hypothetical protein [Roseateles toxinivorans]|uniref:Uncharacterized protein n=1 Tax=Roseateles toxinivorans TaxID=270368 RepID=A0A4R6QPL4_9BURK|nr:hypothetical protein [Roseateles toxinivorans]TDP71571.1 hypothetical protein DES47_103552 [Roseateles toxinivorans]
MLRRNTFTPQTCLALSAAQVFAICLPQALVVVMSIDTGARV